MVRAFALICFAVMTAYSGGSVLLVGGGSEDFGDWSDTPYRWFVTHAPNRHIIVLDYEDTSTFYAGYFSSLSPCTVTNLAITSHDQANDTSTASTILAADGIFLRGGDQWQYVSLWRGTLVQEAIRQVYERGGVVGGTSAGEAVLSEIVFDAQYDTVVPRDALRDPANAGISLTDDFLRLQNNIVADSHFYERGRLGRLPVFMACYKAMRGREIVGVGVDYNTALGVDTNGVGEVMGAGTVTILRYTPSTRISYAREKPMSARDILFDQLTVGTKIDMRTFEFVPPSAAFPYAPVQWSPLASRVFLDGSNGSSVWSADNGSLRRLVGTLTASSDTVGIICPVSSSASGSSVAAILSGWNVPSVLIGVGMGIANDSSTAAGLRACRAFVFAGNNPDSIGGILDTATLVGRSFRQCLKSDPPVLFLSDDMLSAGIESIGAMYRNAYAAYDGFLTHGEGVGVLAGMQAVPRLFENSSYIDSRASAVFWSMALDHLPYGLLLDAGTQATIVNGSLTVYGSTPALLVDARAAVWGSLPEFRAHGKVNPRQNGGIIGGKLHIIAGGESFDLVGSTSSVAVTIPSPVPIRHALLQCYPNPFNGNTMIQYSVDGDRPVEVTVAIYDLLGREVAIVARGIRQPGMHTTLFDARALASGMYYCRLTGGNICEAQPLMLLR
jgi:cyanophycinase